MVEVDAPLGSVPLPSVTQWQRASWLRASLYAAPVCLLVLHLFHYWFAVADRYAVFLYSHLGATPFDSATSTRYWMGGLVAAGFVMVLYTLVNWFAARIRGLHYLAYRPPPWWQVWLLCLIPLSAGIPLLTMTVNSPTLPPVHAAAALAAALTGLAFALAPGALAAERPAELGWLVLAGAGLGPILLLLRAIELPARGMMGVPVAWWLAGGSLGFSVLWLAAVSMLRARRHPPMGAAALFLTGLGLSYVLLPMLHYLLLTPSRFHYISTASNFFAWYPAVQVVSLLLAAIAAAGAVRFQKALRRSWPRSPGRIV